MLVEQVPEMVHFNTIQVAVVEQVALAQTVNKLSTLAVLVQLLHY
jgi:hypothetical protein